jgi:nicotinamide mononucleotide transporter
MSFTEIWQQFLGGLQQTSTLELISGIAGIVCVWFSKKENILVYPIGLINTIGYLILSVKSHLLGEASVNLYYTAMSIYGWILWAKKDQLHRPVVKVKFSNRKQLLYQVLFFAVLYFVLYFSLQYLKKDFAPGAIPWADAFAASAAYTGMWLMAKKKVESWYWWILTNCASIPLYFTKGLVFTSFQYFVLLVLAVMGLFEWMKKAKAVENIQRTETIHT